MAQALVALRYMRGGSRGAARLRPACGQAGACPALAPTCCVTPPAASPPTAPLLQVGMPESQANFTRSTADRLFWAGD